MTLNYAHQITQIKMNKSTEEIIQEKLEQLKTKKDELIAVKEKLEKLNREIETIIEYIKEAVEEL